MLTCILKIKVYIDFKYNKLKKFLINNNKEKFLNNYFNKIFPFKTAESNLL